MGIIQGGKLWRFDVRLPVGTGDPTGLPSHVEFDGEASVGSDGCTAKTPRFVTREPIFRARLHPYRGTCHKNTVVFSHWFPLISSRRDIRSSFTANVNETKMMFTEESSPPGESHTPAKLPQWSRQCLQSNFFLQEPVDKIFLRQCSQFSCNSHIFGLVSVWNGNHEQLAIRTRITCSDKIMMQSDIWDIDLWFMSKFVQLATVSFRMCAASVRFLVFSLPAFLSGSRFDRSASGRKAKEPSFLQTGKNTLQITNFFCLWRANKSLLCAHWSKRSHPKMIQEGRPSRARLHVISGISLEFRGHAFACFRDKKNCAFLPMNFRDRCFRWGFYVRCRLRRLMYLKVNLQPPA